MKASGESTDDRAAHRPSVYSEEEKKEQIRLELDNILESRFFRSAGRCKQFLKYVVLHNLEGHSEPLKERTIGVEVFDRPDDYATGDDPVVRVQAREVRRRLEQYYQSTPTGPSVHIELPIGSYSPLFREPETIPSGAEMSSTVAPKPAAPVSLTSPEPRVHQPPRYRRSWTLAAICSALAVAGGSLFLALHHTTSTKSVMDQFWSPVFATHQAVLICLAAPAVYRPTDALYEKYARTHPGTFQSEVEKTNNPLPLDPNETILWSDISNYSNYGVVRGGDAFAAVAVSSVLGKIGKPSQLRVGTNYSFADLRSSPAVVVGAFNNRWTMQLTSNLRFVFVEQNGHFMIRDQTNSAQVWEKRLGAHGEVVDDAAIVSRLLDSKTGQFTIIVAGIGERGTQAAGEFVSNPALLEQGLRNIPAGWQSKNLEIVLQTAVTDLVPGPPRVVAAYSW